LYGCDTWSLTLREKLRLRLFDNRVLRRIFRPKRDEVTGEWREMHNMELHYFNSSPDITSIRYVKSRQVMWAGHMARMGEEKMCVRVWWERPKERDQSETKV
jgi:hypothetical protein